jgi:hypothetical protein
MLPPFERDHLAAALTRAHSLAAAGYLAAGYGVLWLGRRRAEALEWCGVPWGAVLVACWEQSCAEFCAIFGVSIPD